MKPSSIVLEGGLNQKDKNMEPKLKEKKLILQPEEHRMQLLSPDPSEADLKEFMNPIIKSVVKKTFLNDDLEGDTGVEIDPSFQMSSCITPYSYPDAEKWEVDFCEYLKGNVPRPGLYNNQMVFYGGLKPLGSPKFLPDEEAIVFSPKDGYKLIKFSEFNRITDKMYFKFFKPLYEKNYVRYKEISVRNVTYVYMILGNNKFQNFKGD